MPNYKRKRVQDFPNREWPQDFPFVRCPQPSCEYGVPAQDKYDLKCHHHKVKHPGVAFTYDNLISCTYKEWIDYKESQSPQPALQNPTASVPARPNHGSLAARPIATELSSSPDLLPPALSSILAHPPPGTINPQQLDYPIGAQPHPVANLHSQRVPSILTYGQLGLQPQQYPAVHVYGQPALPIFPSSQLNFQPQQHPAANLYGQLAPSLPISSPLELQPLAPFRIEASVSGATMRSKVNRNDPGFEGYGCYLPKCDFATTSKQALSNHLGNLHSLSQQEKDFSKIILINNPEIGNTGLPAAAAAPIRTTQRAPDRPVIFIDPLPPWRPSTDLTQAPRAKPKFDHTRLPVFYKCYVDGCEVLGRTPEAILKHWLVDQPASIGNPTHCGHLWEIEQVYKFIRGKENDVHVTTHGQDPVLPTAKMLDPKNVKQYRTPLEHTNVAVIKVRSTAVLKPDDTEVWSCTLCDCTIGTLHATKEHVADCHGFMALNHNDSTKMIHYLAACAGADGQVVCHMPDWNRNECRETVDGDLLLHLEEAHGVLEDDLLANEETGRVFVTIAKMKE